jgi:predicted DsbA family dithiol-disulfide isomerase
MIATGKMKVEVWSDVTCPFCYIAKRKFESALSQFKDASDIEIIWKSFELAPGMQTVLGKSVYQYLSEHGMTIEQAKAASEQLANMGRQVGLAYDFDKVIPANSFRAHGFSHLAKQHGVQNAAEEILFRSYFTDGKNIDDISTLVQLGKEIGLDAGEVQHAVENNIHANEVRQDIAEARGVNVKSVPFYMFDGKQTLTGAQEPAVFADALAKSFGQWKKEQRHTMPVVEDAASCNPGGECLSR